MAHIASIDLNLLLVLHTVLEEQNATVLGISADGVASHRQFKTKYNLPFVLLADEDHAVAEAYGVWQARPNFPLGMGIVRSQFVIDEQGSIADIQIEISASDSAERAIFALE